MKESSNAIVVPNRKLDMASLVEAAARKELTALPEHSSNRIERFNRSSFWRLCFHNFVQVTQDRAIQIAEDTVRIWLTRCTFIFWDGKSRLSLDFHKRLMGRLEQFRIFSTNQIEAVSEVDNSAHHGRVRVIATLDLPLGPLKGALGIRLPKVGAWAKPIEITVTLKNVDVAGDSPIGDVSVAPVVTEHK